MRGGWLVYKCRKCGKLDRSAHVPDVRRALVSIGVDGRTPREWGNWSGLTGMHYCTEAVGSIKSGQGAMIGVSDLISAEEDP